MNAFTAAVYAAIIGGTSELATWNRRRTSDELQSFVDTHHALLPEAVDIEE